MYYFAFQEVIRDFLRNIYSIYLTTFIYHTKTLKEEVRYQARGLPAKIPGLFWSGTVQEGFEAIESEFPGNRKLRIDYIQGTIKLILIPAILVFLTALKVAIVGI